MMQGEKEIEERSRSGWSILDTGGEKRRNRREVYSSFTSEKPWNHLFSLHCKHTSMHTFKHVLCEQISTVGTKSRRWWTVRQLSYSSRAFPARMPNNVFTVRKSMLWQQKAVLTALATSNLIVFLTCCLSSFHPCYMSFSPSFSQLCCCFCLLVVFLLCRNAHTPRIVRTTHTLAMPLYYYYAEYVSVCMQMR